MASPPFWMAGTHQIRILMLSLMNETEPSQYATLTSRGRLEVAVIVPTYELRTIQSSERRLREPVDTDLSKGKLPIARRRCKWRDRNSSIASLGQQAVNEALNDPVPSGLSGMRPGSHEHSIRRFRMANADDFQRRALGRLADQRDCDPGIWPDCRQPILEI